MKKQKRNKRIGIFDSGFGGLHVLRSIVRALPRYDYVFLADTARAPYGQRSQKTIYGYTKQAVDFLFGKNCGIVIVACNTASSKALRTIQDRYGAKKKVLGVLIPAAEEAVRTTKSRRIGVIATEATVASKKFIRELAKLDSDLRVFQQACPLLVPLVEAGKQDSREMRLALVTYLRPLLRKKIDTLILGCTHYGILEKQVRAIVGTGITIVSEARVVPKKLEDYFARHGEIEQTLSRGARIRFYSTDGTGNFKTLGSKLFGQPIEVEKATLHRS